VSRFHATPRRRAAKRGRPRRSYELLTCGWRGHVLAGADAADVGGADSALAREGDGVRWHRCLRCDSWLALEAPRPPARERVPERHEIELPLRGKPLPRQDRAAADRCRPGAAFPDPGTLAVAVFCLRGPSRRAAREVLQDPRRPPERGRWGPVQTSKTGVLHELDHLFTLQTTSLDLLGAVLAAYALLEGVEAVFLWKQKRWAEYLTFVATTVLLPVEIYELAGRVSWFKLVAFLVNLVVVVYLIYAKRLFGCAAATRSISRSASRALGWGAIERATPPAATASPGRLLQTLARLAHQRDRLREDDRHHRTDLLGLRLGAALEVDAVDAATVNVDGELDRVVGPGESLLALHLIGRTRPCGAEARPRRRRGRRIRLP